MVEIERQKYYGILVTFYHFIHTQLQSYAYHPLTIVIEYTEAELTTNSRFLKELIDSMLGF